MPEEEIKMWTKTQKMTLKRKMTPLFDGTYYAYWKVRMRAFLQSLDDKVWQAMDIGWTKPTKAPAD